MKIMCKTIHSSLLYNSWLFGCPGVVLVDDILRWDILLPLMMGAAAPIFF